VLGLAASLEPGELALDVPGEIQPRVRERRAHAGEPLLHEGPQEGVPWPRTSTVHGTPPADAGAPASTLMAAPAL
jgi:hypothetical protein